MDAIQAMQNGQEYELRRPSVKAAELGPYPFPVKIRVDAYSKHADGGDSSWATQDLYYDAARVGSSSDRKFNVAHLHRTYNVVIDGGNDAQFRIATDNSGATESDYGFVFWLSRARF